MVISVLISLDQELSENIKFDTVFKFISKQLIINMLSTWNHPDNWLPWINPTRTRDRADSKVKFHEKSTIHS